jgi:ribosomal-protein-alanine N-acetyltransferase
MEIPFPELKTNRLLLRQFVKQDIDNVYRGLSDPAVIQFYGVSFRSLGETKEQMKWFDELEKNGTGIWWAICSADSSIFYGASGLNNLQKKHAKAEAGFWLLPEYWGLEIFKEAMPLILNYGFDHLDLHRIEGFVESNNVNCKKALEKIDFNYEGTRVDCEIKNGKFISLDIFAKINPENKYNP